jgi:hypothetical protein
MACFLWQTAAALPPAPCHTLSYRRPAGGQRSPVAGHWPGLHGDHCRAAPLAMGAPHLLHAGQRWHLADRFWRLLVQGITVSEYLFGRPGEACLPGLPDRKELGVTAKALEQLQVALASPIICRGTLPCLVVKGGQTVQALTCCT